MSLIKEMSFLDAVSQELEYKYDQHVSIGFYNDRNQGEMVEFFLLESGYYATLSLAQLKRIGILRAPDYVLTELMAVDYHNFSFHPHNGYRGFVFHYE